uniref:Zinc finger protein 934 n=1 Tax=Mus musculus TaxID=10090 RepID=A0A1Y7VMB8_MOUSE
MQNSRKAFCLLGQLPCMPQRRQEVFRSWCPVALCTEEPLKFLQAVVSSGDHTSWLSVDQLP